MRRIHVAILALCAIGYCSPQVLATQAIRTIALKGQQAPGTPPGVTFSTFGGSVPILNNAGQVVFRSILAGPGIDPLNSEGLWLEESGRLGLLVRENEPVPGFPEGAVFHGLDLPLISDNGEVAFLGYFRGSGINSSNDTAYMTIQGGVINTIARKGDPAPGTTSTEVFGSNSVFVRPLFSAAGQLAFKTFTSYSGSDGNWTWTEQEGLLSAIAYPGMPAPGLPSGQSFRYTAIDNDTYFGINSAGQVAFVGSASTTYSFQGVWQSTNGVLTPIAVAGQQAVGMPVGMNLIDVQTISLNSAGQILYSGRCDDGDFNPFNDNGIWLNAGGRTELILQSGQQAPGFDHGVTLQALGGSLNSRGQMLISGTMTGISSARDFAFWKRDPSGELEVVVSEGDQAPGLPSGHVFMDRGDIGHIYPGATFNSLGRMAFIQYFKSSITNLPLGEGIWAEDIDGNLQLIAATGMDLEVLPGDVRTISSLLFYGIGNIESGHRSGFNNRGQVAFYATFTDGTSGIFVSNLVAVPEPCTLALLTLAVVLRGRRW